MRTGLTIGEFARMTRLSIRTLRRYHEAGLLEPAEVDPFTGYRYYRPEQIPAAQVIVRLRQLDMPLREVGEVLATADPDARAGLIGGHLQRLEAELDRTRAAVTSLRRLLQPDSEQLDVELRSEPARTVTGVAVRIRREELAEAYEAAMAAIGAALAGRETGPPGGVYDNELFTQGRGTMIIYRPAAGAPQARHEEPAAWPARTVRAWPLTLPAADLAVAVHHGPHSDLDVSYGRLGRHVADHALAIAGPVREVYLTGPADTDDQSAWRTEIGWPVFRVGAAGGETPPGASSS